MPDNLGQLVEKAAGGREIGFNSGCWSASVYNCSSQNRRPRWLGNRLSRQKGPLAAFEFCCFEPGEAFGLSIVITRRAGFASARPIY
jgi:hypothetical protein